MSIMKLQKNAKRIMPVFLAALVLGGCGGAGERKAEYLSRAQALMQEGNYEKARVEFKNVLQIDPKDAKAHFLLAQALEKLQNFQEAGGHYLAVIELDKSHVGARVKLGQIYLSGGAIQEAAEQAKEAIKLDTKNPAAYALRGAVRVRQGDLEGAWADGEQGLKLDPAHVESLALLASIHLNRKEVDQALALLDRGLKQHPDHVDLRIAKARIHADRNELAEAADALRELLKLDPKNLGVRAGMAEIYVRMKAPDKAEQVLREGVSVDPANSRLKLALVEFLGSQRDKALAEKELLAYIEKEPDAHSFRLALGELYEAANQPDKATQVYKKLIGLAEGKPEGLTARNRLASILLQQKDSDGAAKLVEEVLKESPNDSEALSTRGEIALGRKNIPSAIADFRAALRGHPDSTRLVTRLARAHLMNNEPELAIDSLKKGIEANPADVELRAELANLLAAKMGNMGEAMEQLQEALKIDPKNITLQQALFKAEADKNDWAAAHKTAERIKREFPDRALGYHLSGLAYQGERNFEASLGEFEQALDLAPDAAEPLSQLVKSYLALNKPEEAQKRLAQAIKEHPKDVAAHNLSGEVFFLQQDQTEAAAAFRRAIEANPRATIPYQNLAAAQLATKNDLAAAAKIYEQGLEATSRSPVLVTGLAGIYEQMGKIDEAAGLYEELLKGHPDSLVVANNLAMLLADHRKDPESLKRAGELVERLKKSSEPTFLDTVGWVRYAQGEIDAAAAMFEQALKASPDLGAIHYHMGMVYLRKGDAAKAMEHLEKALASKDSFIGREEAQAALEKAKGAGGG
jgi:tetratricopeptide (TPR) repeat protein